MTPFKLSSTPCKFKHCIIYLWANATWGFLGQRSYHFSHLFNNEHVSSSGNIKYLVLVIQMIFQCYRSVFCSFPLLHIFVAGHLVTPWHLAQSGALWTLGKSGLHPNSCCAICSGNLSQPVYRTRAQRGHLTHSGPQSLKCLHSCPRIPE